MIIYNTTFSVPKDLQNEFLDFIRDEYIPQALKTNLLKEPRLARVFGRDEDNGLSYALEFKTDSVEDLERWNQAVGQKLYAQLTAKFKQNILGFATLLQLIEE